jgi:hypothetical protein
VVVVRTGHCVIVDLAQSKPRRGMTQRLVPVQAYLPSVEFLTEMPWARARPCSFGAQDQIS